VSHPIIPFKVIGSELVPVAAHDAAHRLSTS